LRNHACVRAKGDSTRADLTRIARLRRRRVTRTHARASAHNRDNLPYCLPLAVDAMLARLSEAAASSLADSAASITTCEKRITTLEGEEERRSGEGEGAVARERGCRTRRIAHDAHVHASHTTRTCMHHTACTRMHRKHTNTNTIL
jgi:hypothetical protein